MKFTLIAENESIRESGTKITHEFYATSAEKAIEQFTKFLRGSGVFFEGSHTIHANPKDAEVRIAGYSFDNHLDSYRSSSVFAHMAKDLEKNPPKMTDEIKIDINQYNFDNMGNMGVSGISGGAGEDRITITDSFDEITISTNSEAKCSLCNLPVNVMKIHQCFDPKCPIDCYKSQYQSEK